MCINPMFFVRAKVTKDNYLIFKNHNFKVNTNTGYAYKWFSNKMPDMFEKFHLENPDIKSIPCGKCLECNLNKAKEWANRCVLESKEYKENYFLTLTYDDDHLPIGDIGNATLVKDDFRKFIKKLRNLLKYKYNVDGVRYFGCGEYGEKSLRPHYHIILFNCPLGSLNELIEAIPYIDETGKKRIVTKLDANGDSLYYSPIVHDAWNKKGNILIGRCTWHSCNYVSRYVTKKLVYKDKDLYSNLGIEKEFINMSNHPGIGYNYAIKNLANIYYYDNLVISEKNLFSKPPKYFDKILQKVDDYTFNYIKSIRESLSEDVISIDFKRDISYNDFVKNKGSALEKKTKILKRGKI